MYQYKLNSTGGSSLKYGLCEVCKKAASEVVSQSKSKEYVKSDGNIGLSHVSTTYGHEHCLEGIRL